jgi:lipoate-protein ligase A
MDWRLIFDDPADGVWNMSVDEALLESAGRAGQGGCLRFYRWKEATVSLGYFQRVADRHTHPASRQCPLVRRCTGGGAIIHDRELTYSLTVPIVTHVKSDLREYYEAFHGSLAEVLSTLGVAATICRLGDVRPGRREPFLCFQRRSDGDLLVSAVKIAGSAQRRHRTSLLQHGSVLLERSDAAPELPGLAEVGGLGIHPWELARRWTDRIAGRLGVTFQEGELSDREREMAGQRGRGRFGDRRWTCRR